LEINLTIKTRSFSGATIFYFWRITPPVIVNKFFVGIRVKYTHSVGDPVEKETSISTW